MLRCLPGFAIFPIVFASGLDPAEGPGLIFVTLPVAFGNMAGGHIFGTMFFVLLLFAAYTSAIGMLEPVVAWLEERRPGRRKQMAMIAGACRLGLGTRIRLLIQLHGGLPAAGFPRMEKNFFGIADFTVANVLAPINAFLIALFAGWVVT